MITVEKIDGGITVKFPYNKDDIEKIKTLTPHNLGNMIMFSLCCAGKMD